MSRKAAPYERSRNALSEMSLRHQAPFQRMFFAAVKACSLAAEMVAPIAVTPITAPRAWATSIKADSSRFRSRPTST